MHTRPTEERVIDFSGRTLGPYLLRQRVGEGGYSTVYRAEHATERTIVAVKVLNPTGDRTTIERFRREIELSRNLFEQDGNRHVIHVFECGEDDGLRWYAMEYLDGHNLRAVLRAVEGEGLRWEVAAFVLQNVCYAVAKMHEREVLHRDLKPDNIILERTVTGQLWVKIIDLGIAKEISVESKIGEGPYQTSRNELPGTPPYIAPERFKGAPCAPAADQYSLGILLYECLHGRLPFPETDNIATAALQALGPRDGIVWNPIPRELRLIVLRAMETDSRRRYPNVFELGQALRACLQSAGEYVDGQATTLKLLDRLDQGRKLFPRQQEPTRPPAFSAEPPDKRSTAGRARQADFPAERVSAERVPAERVPAERVPAELPPAERLTAERAAAARSVAEERPAGEGPRLTPRETEVSSAVASSAMTRAGEEPRSFILRHGETLFNAMTRSITVAVIAIVAMTECVSDTNWMRLHKRWSTPNVEPSVLSSPLTDVPEEQPRLPAGTRRTRIEVKPPEPGPLSASKLEQPPVPSTDGLGQPLEAPPPKAPPRTNPTTAATPSAPRPLPATTPGEGKTPPRPTTTAATPSASSPRPVATPDGDLLPVGPATPREPAKPQLNDVQLTRRAQDQVRRKIAELCKMNKDAPHESVQVCLELVLDNSGAPTGAYDNFSVSPALASIDLERCIVRVARANIKLANSAPLPKSITPCFKIDRQVR